MFKVKEGDDFNPPDFHQDSQEYIEIFRGLKSEHDAACPAIAYCDGGSLGKMAIYGWALVNPMILGGYFERL